MTRAENSVGMFSLAQTFLLPLQFCTTLQKRAQPWGGFLKIVSVGIPTYTGAKTGFSRADVSVETGFRAGIGQNADWNKL